MSYIEIYAFDSDGTRSYVGKVGNALGYCVSIFRTLKEVHNIPGGTMENHEFLWLLAGEERPFREYEKVALLTTGDRVVVRQENLQRLCGALRELHSSRPGDMCSAVTEMADFITADCLQVPGIEAIGFAFSNTDNLWFIYEDEEDEDGRPYNLNSDEGHFEIFEWLEQTSQSKA